MAAVTFATGAYAAWGSTFYQTVRGMSMKDAGDWIGRLDRGRRPGWNRAGHIPCRLSSKVHPACLSAAGQHGGRARRSPGHRRRSSTRSEPRRWAAVRGDGADGDGARAMQHGHRQRRAGQSAGRGLRAVHLPDPSVRRHQLANLAGCDFQAFGIPGALSSLACWQSA